ncbi:hypothetical protein DV737_g4909, partial [Chaetothyriales sp. CBS 132003]
MASVSAPPAMVSPLSPPLPPRSPRRPQQRVSSNTASAEPLSRLPPFSFHPAAIEPAEPSERRDGNESDEDSIDTAPKKPAARPALPDFRFNPGADLPAQRSPSPTHPVLQEMALNQQRAVRSSRPVTLPSFALPGHSASAETSPSPTKSAFADTPHSAGTGMGHRRRGIAGYSRGHTHRRSQAVSISDIDASDLIKTSALPRVGFADRVDVIPRPLSLISSETEGSCSTVRGHSLSSSINSIASPAPKPPSAVASPVLVEAESRRQQRPKTADAATLFSASTAAIDRSVFVSSLPKRPLSASDSPGVPLSGSPPNKKKYFWSSSSPALASPTAGVQGQDGLDTAATDLPGLAATSPPRPRTSPERSISIKKRKYSTWTAGIFSKRARKRSSKVKSKRVPTPPLQRRTSDKINKIFDQDDTVVLREPSPIAQRGPQRPCTAYTLTPSSFVSPTEAEAEVPTLDLDAALGLEDDGRSHDPASRSATSRIAKLHSSERRPLDAFGVLHKRAESAPLMQPVNRSLFGMQRMGSSPSVRDEVFDEEEEDYFLAHRSEDESDADTSQMPSAKIEPADASEPVDAGLSDALAQSVDGLGLSVRPASVSDAVVIVDPDDEITAAEQRSSKSTIEAPVPPGQFVKRPLTSPVIFAYPGPRSNYASSTEGRTTSASMISSPDADHISFDNFARTTRYLAEPNSEYMLKTSNEDLPSLSDSISSGAVPRFSSSANTTSSIEQRSASVCVPSTSKSHGAPWKRASLASLNRLMPGSANGSKLKFEATPNAANEEKAKKKTNRLSKLMNFWRSKEKGEVPA